jgi:hypothetical protein
VAIKTAGVVGADEIVTAAHRARKADLFQAQVQAQVQVSRTEIAAGPTAVIAAATAGAAIADVMIATVGATEAGATATVGATAVDAATMTAGATDATATETVGATIAGATMAGAITPITAEIVGRT